MSPLFGSSSEGRKYTSILPPPGHRYQNRYNAGSSVLRVARQTLRVRGGCQCLVSLAAIRTVHTHSAGKLKLELPPTPRHEVSVSSDWIADFKGWLGRQQFISTSGSA